MTKPIPYSAWQLAFLPTTLPRHIRRNIVKGANGCWLWKRSKNIDGYGWASLNDKTYQAHALVYQLLRGKPGVGLQLDHLCRVRHCVNPDHLEPVTCQKNLLRSPLTPAGRTTCAKGHALTHNGHQRRCQICLAEYEESRRQEKIMYARNWRKKLRESNALKSSSMDCQLPKDRRNMSVSQKAGAES